MSTRIVPALLALGRLGRAHGLSGELRLEPYWANSTTIFEIKRVLLRWPEQGREQELRVAAVRPLDRGALLRFAGVADRTAAEALKGAEVSAFRSDLPALEPGEYYLVDLIGAEVHAPDGVVGKVVELGFYPSADSLIIEASDGSRCEQPLTPPWVETVDPDLGRVVLTSREGLIL